MSDNLLSVTEILSPFSDFSRISPSVLEHAAERGTLVHDICARLAKGIWVPDSEIGEECAGYVDSFKKWLDSQVQEVILMHERLVDERLFYSGEIDIFVRLKSDTHALIDLKTPIALQRVWAGQLAGYRNLLIVNKYIPEACGSLRLDPNGKAPKMKWYESSLDDFNAFLSALNAVRYFKGGK